jgi:hypothetical protein
VPDEECIAISQEEHDVLLEMLQAAADGANELNVEGPELAELLLPHLGHLPQKMLQVFIETLSGKTVALRVSSAETLEGVKREIAKTGKGLEGIVCMV